MNDKNLRRAVAMQRIDTARRLSGAADIKPRRFVYVHMPTRILGNFTANDGEVFFALCSRVVNIDEGSAIRD